MSDKCGKPAASWIPRWSWYFACVLEPGHEGECKPGGTCHVHGEVVKEYGFTSSLPVQILKMMKQSLMHLLLESREKLGRPDGFPGVNNFSNREGGMPAMPSSLIVPNNPRLTAEAVSKMLQGPAIPDTNLVHRPNMDE